MKFLFSNAEQTLQKNKKCIEIPALVVVIIIYFNMIKFKIKKKNV